MAPWVVLQCKDSAGTHRSVAELPPRDTVSIPTIPSERWAFLEHCFLLRQVTILGFKAAFTDDEAWAVFTQPWVHTEPELRLLQLSTAGIEQPHQADNATGLSHLLSPGEINCVIAHNSRGACPAEGFRYPLYKIQENMKQNIIFFQAAKLVS